MGGAMSRRKGKEGERSWAKFLRGYGFSGARRGQQFKGGPESPDVVGVPGIHWEVKRSETFSPYNALEQAATEAPIGAMPVVAHRRNDKHWIVVLSAENFCSLLRRADAEQEDGAAGREDGGAAPERRPSPAR